MNIKRVLRARTGQAGPLLSRSLCSLIWSQCVGWQNWELFTLPTFLRLEACKATDAESRPSNLQVSALPLAAIYHHHRSGASKAERGGTQTCVPDRCGYPWHNFCQGEAFLELQLKRKHRNLPAGPSSPVPRSSPVGHPGDTPPSPFPVPQAELRGPSPPLPGVG